MYCYILDCHTYLKASVMVCPISAIREIADRVIVVMIIVVMG
jgi:hypothetical protein